MPNLQLGNLLTAGNALLAFPNKYSFNFDGSNDYLETSDIGLPSGSNARTFACWIKNTRVDAFRAIIHYGTSSNNQSNFISIGDASDGYKLHMAGFNNTADGSTDAIPNNEWCHIAVVYSSNAVNYYINGVASGGDSSFTGINTVLDGTLAIGKDKFSNTYIDALIDEIAIWDTALSSADIAKIGSKPVDLTKASKYATDRTGNLKLYLRCGDKAEPESNTAIARQDFYTDFDGTDDLVLIDDAGDIMGLGSNSYSVSAWVKVVDATNNQTYTYFSAGSGSSQPRFKLQVITLIGTNSLKAVYEKSDGSHLTITCNTTIDTEWHHLAFVEESSTSRKFYQDGELVPATSTVYSTGSSFTPDTGYVDYVIGANRTSSANQFLDGSVSSVSLHKTPLDAQTIKQFAKSRFTPMRDNRFSVVDFDGVNDFIDIPDNDALDAGSGDMTITFWYNPLSMSANMEIIDKYDTSSNKGYKVRHHNGTSKVFFQINDGADSDGYYSYIDVALSYGQWYHVTIIWDNSEQQATYYINGVNYGRASSTALRSIGDTSNSVPLRFGGTQTGANDYKGSISSIAIYNVARTTEEDYACYQKGITHNPSADTGLVGLWRMGNDTSKAFPTIADSSSNSNDGTMTNMASDDIVQQMVAGYDLGAFESTGEELSKNTFGGLNQFVAKGSVETVEVSGDELTLTIASGNDAGMNTGNLANLGLSTSLGYAVGDIVKLQFQAKIVTNGSGFGETVRWYDVNQYVFPATNISLTSEYQTFTFINKITNLGYSIPSFLRMGNRTGTDVYNLKNFSVQKVFQSADLSDTHPAIIDVNEPVLGAETLTHDFSDGTGVTVPSSLSSLTTFNGEMVVNGGSVGSDYYVIADNVTWDTSKVYKIVVVCSAYTSGGLTHQGGSATFGINFGISSSIGGVGTFTNYAVPNQDGIITLRSQSFIGTLSSISIKEVQGNVGTMTNQDSSDLVYSSVLPDQSFLAGLNSAYNYFDFGGTDEYIDIPQSVSTYPFSVSAWVKPLSGQTAYIFSIADINTDSEYKAIFWSNATSKFTMIDRSSGIYNKVSGALSADTWHHVVAVFASTSSRSLYVNGVINESSESSGTSGGFTSNLDNQAIGALRRSAGASYGVVEIGQTAIWNKELSSTEVLAIYTAGRHSNLLDSYSDNLKGYWAMSALDAKTGLSDVGNGTIYDRSGNSNHGTATNTESSDLKSSPNAEPNGYAKGDTNRSTTIP